MGKCLDLVKVWLGICLIIPAILVMFSLAGVRNPCVFSINFLYRIINLQIACKLENQKIITAALLLIIPMNVACLYIS